MDELSRDEATLLTAEGALEFMFNELNEIGSSLSCSLLEPIKVEIGKRRNRQIVSLLKFLQNFESLHEITDSFFDMTSKKIINKTACEVFNNFFRSQSKYELTKSMCRHTTDLGLISQKDQVQILNTIQQPQTRTN